MKFRKIFHEHLKKLEVKEMINANEDFFDTENATNLSSCDIWNRFNANDSRENSNEHFDPAEKVPKQRL